MPLLLKFIHLSTARLTSRTGFSRHDDEIPLPQLYGAAYSSYLKRVQSALAAAHHRVTTPEACGLPGFVPRS